MEVILSFAATALIFPFSVMLEIMVRDMPQFPGGPVEAEVHPDEVEGMAAFDWRLAPEQEEETTTPPEDTKPPKGKKSTEAEPTG